MNRPIILIISLFLVFIVMGAASAATDDSIIDTVSTDVSVTNDFVKYTGEDAVSTDDNTETLADNDNTVGSFSELEQYINDNKGYEKTVTLNKDYVFNNETDMDYNVNGVYLGTYVEIDGQGHTIDAQGTNYIFNTIGKHITLKNIVFKNTIYRAIEVGSSNVNIINCTFDNNTNRAVGLSTSALECIIDDCTFKNGAGLYVSASGTIIYNCRFINNTNGNGAGINIASTDVVIDNCIFLNNTATNYGGAIYFSYGANGILTIKKSYFNANEANTGGAIYTQNARWSSNKWESYYNTVNISSSAFSGNKAVNNPELGAVEASTWQTYNLDSTTSRDDEKYYDDIDKLFDNINQGTITLNKNYVLTHGPLRIFVYDSLTIDGNGYTIDANNVTNIFQFTAFAPITIKNIRLINSSGTAVTITVYSVTNITIYNSSFANNHAYNNAVFSVTFNKINTAQGSFIINKTTFESNHADHDNGVMYFKGGDSIYLINSSFINNSAGNNNGVWENNVGYKIINSTFIGNSAISYAVGAGANFLDNNSKFINNSAYQFPVPNLLSSSSKSFEDINNTILFYFPLIIKGKGDFNELAQYSIPKGTYFVPMKLTASKNFISVFDGNGSTLRGNGNVMFGYGNAVTNIGITYKNMILINASLMDDGGSSRSFVIIENVTFINCTNVIKTWPNAKYIFRNVSFINCSYPILNINDGGFVKFEGNNNIDGVVFNDNFSKNFESLSSSSQINLKKDTYYVFSTISLSSDSHDVVIDGNGSTLIPVFGQAIFNIVSSTNVTIKNFIFKNCSNNYPIIFKSNNAISNNQNYISNITVIDSNYAVSSHNSLKNSILHVENCNFSNIANSITMDNCMIINSTFTKAFVELNVGNVINCNFTKIKNYGDGGAIKIQTSINITDCNFINCTALSGGSIYQSNPSGVVNVSKSSFNGGKAYSAGGAIYCGGTLIIDDCEFTNNNADNCAGFLAGNGLTLTDSNFTNNGATLGGAGSVDGDDTLIESCTFNANNAMVGGGLNIQGTNGTVKNCRFINNTASAVSSAMQITGDETKLINVVVEGSSAPDGAAILIEGNNAKITGCTFKDNTATDVNGSMLTVNGNGTNLDKVNVTGNNGHGITLNGDNATITDSIIADNNGTGITVNGNGAHVENTNITDNNGDAVVINGDDAKFTENTINGNNGTGMTVNGNNATVEENNITSNTGDGIVINGNETKVTDNIIGDNNGTGMTINGNDATVEDNTLLGNDEDIVIGEDSNMNTPENIEKLSEDNNGAEVLKDNGLNIIVQPDIIHVDDNITLTINMATGAGTVRVTLNGKTYNLTETGTVDLGRFSVGDYNITVEFTPNAGFTAADTTVIPVHVQNWNFTELQQIIDNAIANNTAADLGGHTFICEEDEQPINITSPVTINGNGAVIDANNNPGAFDINADDVSLNNMTIENVKDGVAINAVRNDTKITDITLTNNTGTGINIVGNNSDIENITADNHTGDVISVNGDNATVNDVEVNSGEGTGIEITGKDAKVSNVYLTDHKGEGVVINGDDAKVAAINSVNATSPTLTVNGNNSNITAVSLVNQTGTGVIINGDKNTIDNTTVNGGNGTGIKVKGNNNTVEDTMGNNHTGTLVSIDGNDNIINNSTANGGNGTIVDILAGNNNIIDGVNSTGNHTGDSLVDNGKNTKKSGVSPGNADTVFDLSGANADPAVFKIKLPSDATGNFTVSIGGKDYTASVVNGTATISVPGLASGNIPVVVSYSGDDQYNGLFKTASINVPVKPTPAPTPAPSVGKLPTVLTAKKKVTFKKSKRSKTKTFKATLKTKAGAKLAGKKVFLKLTKVNKIKLSAKTKKAIKKAKAKVKKAKKAYKKSKTAKNKKALAKAKKALTKAKKPQTMLKQLKKGTYAVKTNKKGVAKLTLSKKSFNMKKFKGKAKLTATFKGDSSYLKSTKTVKIVLK